MGNLAKRIAKRFRREHRERKPELPQPDQYLFKNGDPMAILRPRSEDVDEKIRLFSAIPEGLPAEAYQAYVGEIMDKFVHQFMGYALRDGRIVDCSGKPIGNVQPGDSLVHPESKDHKSWLRLPDFMTTGRMHTEMWNDRKVLVLPRPDLKADSNTGIVLESPDPADKASIMIRPGGTEVDCHIPTLNKIWTGDPEQDWRTISNTFIAATLKENQPS